MTEKIVAAAVCYKGLTYSMPAPARHDDVVRALFNTLLEESVKDPSVQLLAAQGFLTSTGRFVGRQEALVIAREANQIIDRRSASNDLFSEDVW